MNMQSMRAGVRFCSEHQSSRFSLGVDWLWIVAFLPAVLVMSIVALQPWVAPADLLRDPLAVAELKGAACCKVYDGLVSNLGIVLWMACSAICLFAASVLFANDNKLNGHGTFLLAAGLFTGFLGFDDLFLVHENVLPAFGIPQPATYGGYAMVALAYLAVSWRQILQNRYVLLFTAIMLLGISVTIDWFIHSDQSWRIIAEDGAKFTGISTWTAFHAAAAWQAVSRRTF